MAITTVLISESIKYCEVDKLLNHCSTF